MRSLFLIVVCHITLWSQAQTPTEPNFLKVTEKLELRGLLHTRYQLFEDKDKQDAFDFRRARLDLRGDVAPKVGFRLHVELANGPRVLDAVFTYKAYEFLNINVGQGKLQFCYDNLYSPWNLPTINRAQIDNALSFRENDLYGNQNGRDIGLWVSGKINTKREETKRPVLDYTVGVYNGAGINTGENNSKKDVGATVGVSPLEDLWVYGRYYSGHGQLDNDPGVRTGRSRFGGNISYKYNQWLLEAEYLSGKEESDSFPTLERDGYYLTLGYTPIADKLQLLVRYDHYNANTASDVPNSEITKYVLAANWFFTKVTRIQVEYNLVREEDEQLDNNLLAIQFQAAF